MRAIYLKKYGNSNMAFEERELVMPVAGPGEAIIKVHVFGLNFADVVARRGLYPDAPKLPCVLGYEVAGTIHSLGSEVKDFQPGQRVVSMTRFGGYSEYVKVKALGMALIPERMDFAEATIMATQGCTAYYCAYESVRLHAGNHVLIHAAAGGVGSLLVQMAKSQNCIVYGTASTSKLDYLKSIGVDHAIDYTNTNFDEHIPKKKIDVVFDSIGGKTFKKSFKLLRPTGKMVFFGAADQIKGEKTSKLGALKTVFGFGLFSPLSLLMKSRSLIGVNMLRVADENPMMISYCLKNMMKLVENGTVTVKVDKVFPSNEIAAAHDYLEGRKSMGKICVSFV